MFGVVGYIHVHAQFQVISFDNLEDVEEFPRNHYVQ